MKRRARRFALGLLLPAIGVSAWTVEGRASELFPPKIREHLGLAADPPCTICHATDDGEDGTVVKPFGVSMVGLGTHGDSDTPAMLAALDAAEAQQLDSDRDGIPDITELREGTDPNDGIVDDRPIPQTGCSIDTASEGSFAVFIAVAGIAIACNRRRRRSSPGVAQLANRSPRQC